MFHAVDLLFYMYVNLYAGLMCLTDDDDDSAAMTLEVVVVYIQGIENGATHSTHTHTPNLSNIHKYMHTSSQFMYRISSLYV